MDTEQLARNLSICEYVENSILPILVDYDDKTTGERKAGIHGTGTLFKFVDKYFFITAAHVLTEMDGYDDFIGIPMGKNNIQVLTFQDCIKYFPNDDKLRNIYDIGIIQLSENIGKLLEHNYTFLNEQNIQFRIRRETNVYISGFPYSWGKFDKDKNIVLGKPFRLMSKYKTPSKIYDNFNPKIHILIEYADMYYSEGNENKPIKAEQDLRGISGSSLWAFKDTQSTIWSAEKCLKVVGIQSHVMEAEYIKGTKWIYLIEAFRHIDQNIFNLLEDCCQRQKNYV
jgi:hypothetical protein